MECFQQRFPKQKDRRAAVSPKSDQVFWICFVPPFSLQFLMSVLMEVIVEADTDGADLIRAVAVASCVRQRIGEDAAGLHIHETIFKVHRPIGIKPQSIPPPTVQPTSVPDAVADCPTNTGVSGRYDCPRRRSMQPDGTAGCEEQPIVLHVTETPAQSGEPIFFTIRMRAAGRGRSRHCCR